MLRLLGFDVVLLMLLLNEISPSGTFIKNEDESVGYIQINGLGEGVSCTSNKDQATRFQVVAGLYNACEGSISFKVNDQPNVYLRHYDNILKSANYSGGDETLEKDASFFEEQSLSEGLKDIDIVCVGLLTAYS
ncbi:hypothetical protein ACHWQZ_G005980 [Mnemiopsis leidyi]